jgi:hypothetical protein
MQTKKIANWTSVLTLVYAIYLVILNWQFGLSMEKDLVFFYNRWAIPSPFEVSGWWYLLVGPIGGAVLMFLNKEYLIVGHEPNQLNFNLRIKHHTRTMVFIIEFFSAAIAGGSLVIMAIIYPLSWAPEHDPLSAGLTLAIVGAITYIIGGFLLECLTTLLWGTLLDDLKIIGAPNRRFSERYDLTFAFYAKMGVKGIPFLLGLTTGFMTISLCRPLSNFLPEAKK